MAKSQEMVVIHSKANIERFTELLETIDRNAQGFREVGDALREIYETELWRITHKSFTALCSERWGFNKTYSYDLVESSRVVNRLVNNFSAIAEKPYTTLSTIVLPTNEGQARELAKVEDHEQAEVWSKVLEETDTPTAKIVRSVVKQWNKLKEAIAPKPKPKVEIVEEVEADAEDDTESAEESLPNGGKVYKRDAASPEWYADDNGVAVPLELYPVWRLKKKYSRLSQELPSFELSAAIKELGQSLNHEPTIAFADDLHARLMAMCAEIRESISTLQPSVVLDGQWYSRTEVSDA